MKYEKGTQNDNVVDVRGRKASAAPKVAGGSIAVVILGLIISRVLGVDVTGFFGGGGGGGGAAQQQQRAPSQGPGQAAPLDGNDPDAELVDFIKFVMKDIQDAFAAQFKAQGREYQFAKLYIFSDAINTACGHAGKDIGPFYCPGDSNAYIDLSFYRDLKKRFGAPGDFAQAYVLAHEIGHHLQNLTRAEGKEPRKKPGESKNQYSVRVELQADCYAGVWGSTAKGKKLLEEGDLEEALTAATAIGDDRLQQQAGMEVSTESFTHGTSAQRVAWFRKGYESGTFAACDTFAPASP
jgi:predicted metalloprotease